MDAVVVYPLEGSNTFMSVTDADNEASKSFHHALWEARSAEDKIRHLFHSFKFMLRLKGFEPPGVEDLCLGKAQVAIALRNLAFNLSSTETVQQLRFQKLGSMEAEYYKNEGGDFDTLERIPEEAWECLETYGAIRPSLGSIISVSSKTR